MFTVPVFTNKMLEKEQDRVWELLDEYLLSVRDNNGTPLITWTRATKKIFPKFASEDNREAASLRIRIAKANQAA